MSSISSNSMPLISVLVPVYNVERYVYEALESIAKQTYSHLQIIVVDDCSTDDTQLIVQDFCAKDSRFVLLKNEKNLQIVKTLNKALNVATGEFIARCDGDDIMEPDRVERQLTYLLKNPDVSLVGCSFLGVKENGEPLREYVYPSGTKLIQKLLRYCSPVSHIWLAHRSVYDVVGPYRIPTVEDYDFLLRADLAGFKLDNIPSYFGMRIRTRTDNTVGKYGVIQRKLFNYAKAVNRFEKRGNLNFFCNDKVKAIIENGSRGNLAKIHYFSDQVSYLASLNKSKVCRLLLTLLAALLSPYKMQYYFNAMMRTLIVKKYFLCN